MAPHRTAHVEMEERLATAVASLLSVFAELPSTPRPIADEAATAARHISLQLPFPPGVVHGGSSHHPSAPTPFALVDRGTLVSSAGLLEAIAAMPSTPPDLRSQAEDVSGVVWNALERA